MKGTNPTIFATHNKKRCMTDGQIFDKIIAGSGDVLYASDIEPYPAKQSLALLLKIG